MKVLEIKNNLVKISYDTDDNLALSGFVIIEDSNNPYVGQVMNLKADPAGNTAIIKLLFTFNNEGILKNYNGTIPSTNATISALPSKELLDVIPADDPIVLGKIAQQNTALKIDKSIFENNLLICSSNFENTLELLENIVSQLEEHSIIIDTEGNFDAADKFVFGKDFRIPLNYNTIDYIYENDLSDVDAVSKAVIQDILIEVQEYIKTLPERFLPFDTFLQVIDAQYRETQIPQLILLKNKLLKYKEANIFAQELKDVMNLSIQIENNTSTVIDLSNLDEKLQREIIEYIYSVLNGISNKVYSFLKISNSNTDKRLLKTVISNSNIFTTIICAHEYKYLLELKEISQNLILFVPLTQQHDFASYNTYLNKLNNNEFIVYGAHTQNIPFITEVCDYNTLEELLKEEETNEDTEEDSIVEENNEQTYPDIFTNENNIFAEEKVETSDEEIIEPVEETADIDLEPQLSEDEIEEVSPVVEEIQEIETVETVEPLETIEPVESVETMEPVEFTEEAIEPVKIIDNAIEDSAVEVYEDFEQESPIELDNEEVQPIEDNTEELVDIEEPVIENILADTTQDDIVEQVAKDVDKVFYEKLPAEDEYDELSTTEFTEELTEDDLDLIDDLAEESFDIEPEELTIEDEEQPPVVPIYPVDDLDEIDAQVFNEGDRVSTAKFGEGIVAGMVNYGNKTLCSIDFPSVGRRLLDPATTEITKLD